MPPDTDPLHPDRLRYSLTNPLSVINGRVQMLQRHADHLPDLSETDRQQLQTHLTAIQTATRDLAKQVDQLVTQLANQAPKDPGSP